MARSLPVRLVPVPFEDHEQFEDHEPFQGHEPFREHDGSRVCGSLALKPYPCEKPVRAAPLRLATEDVEAAADRLVLLAAEVIAGRRGFRQLARQSTAELAEILYEQRDVPVPTRASPPRIRSRRIQQPADGIAEISATVLIGRRAQALALRLILHRGRWRCAAMETAMSC